MKIVSLIYNQVTLCPWWYHSTLKPLQPLLWSFSPLKCHYGGLIFHFKTYTHKVILLVIYPVVSIWLSMKWPSYAIQLLFLLLFFNPFLTHRHTVGDNLRKSKLENSGHGSAAIAFLGMIIHNQLFWCSAHDLVGWFSAPWSPQLPLRKVAGVKFKPRPPLLVWSLKPIWPWIWRETWRFWLKVLHQFLLAKLVET